MIEEQRSYFDRQIKLSNFGEEGQLKLLSSKVLVIGAGGLGHATIQYLVSMGIGEIIICDHDKVEVSNLHRQVLFNQNDVGKYKAQVVKEKLKEHGPWTKIETINSYFDEQLATKLIPVNDIIIDCTDNLATKFMIHDFCYQFSKNLIQASIHKFDGQLQVFNFSKSKNEGCLRCLWDETPMQFGSCGDNGVLGVVPGFFGIMQANEAIKSLLELSMWKHNEILTLDLLSLETNKMRYKKSDSCRLCADLNTITKGVVMNDIDLDLKDINPNDYTWLDIRIASANEKLTTKIAAHNVVQKTDVEIMHQFNELPSERPFIVICDRGMRSKNFAKLLREKGHNNVYSLVGGYLGIEE